VRAICGVDPQGDDPEQELLRIPQEDQLVEKAQHEKLQVGLRQCDRAPLSIFDRVGIFHRGRQQGSCGRGEHVARRSTSGHERQIARHGIDELETGCFSP
jgi:hypothetical protein